MEKWLNKIVLGDSYKLIKELPDHSVDCIYTDLPYLIESGGGGHSELAKRISKTQHQDLSEINKGIDYSILNEFVRVMKRINCYIWCSKLQILDIMKFFLDQDEKRINFEILTWNKTNPTPATNNVWLPDIEYCLYFRESGVALNDGYDLKSKWYVAPINKSDKDLFEHPTIKPFALVKRHLQHATQPHDIVVDCFMGSGTTAVACMDCDRQFIGFEISPKWHKIANDRINSIDANGQMSFFVN